MNEAGNIAAQIQQCVQLDDRFGKAKWCPCKYRQTQVDRAGVDRVDRSVEFQSKWRLGVQRMCQASQVLCEIGIDLPWPVAILIDQRVERKRLAAKPHVVQPAGLGAQVDFDVAQGLSLSQLSKGHREELIQTRKVLDLVLASVIGHTAAKRAQRHIDHELRKYELALVHSGFGRKSAKNPQSDFRRSHRDQIETPNSA